MVQLTALEDKVSAVTEIALAVRAALQAFKGIAVVEVGQAPPSATVAMADLGTVKTPTIAEVEAVEASP